MTKQKLIKYLLVFIPAFFPGLSFAAFSLASATFASVIQEIVGYINLIIPLLITVSFIVFGWGLSKTILNSGSTNDVKNGQNYMLWGIIAFFCLLGVYGIIAFIQGEFGWEFASPDQLLLEE